MNLAKFPGYKTLRVPNSEAEIVTLLPPNNMSLPRTDITVNSSNNGSGIV